MLLLKKYQNVIIGILSIISIPITIPFLAQCTEIVLKAGRIVGTLIRIY